LTPNPADRIRLEGTDPTNWASHGLRKLIRRYVEEMTRWPGGFVVLLPDPEYPVKRPTEAPFARVASGRPVAAFRADEGGGVRLLAVAHPNYEPRVRDCLGSLARLEALGIDAREAGAESVVALAMNLYDEFGIHLSFAPAG